MLSTIQHMLVLRNVSTKQEKDGVGFMGKGVKNSETLIHGYFSPSLLAMYVDTLFMAIGFYMLVPLLGIYFINHLNWSAALAGSIIAVSGLAQNGLRFFCGITADRIGYKNAILLGVVIRIFGFLLYGVIHHPVGYAIAAFVSGAGGAFFHPASFGAYARITPEHMKTKIFGIRETLSNVGFILGPVIGMFLIEFDFSFVCFSAAFMFLLAFFISWLYLPNMEGSSSKQQTFVPIVKKIFKDHRFLVFCVLIIGVWALNVQLYLSVPVRAEKLLEDTGNIAYLYMAGAVFMVLLQIPLLRFLSEKVHQMHIVSIGTFILGVSMLVFGFTQGIWSMLFAVLIFTLGQMLVVPTMNHLISQFADSDTYATYFGFTGWSFAIGGFLGNTGGGYVHDVVELHSEYSLLPWILLFTFACCISVILYKWTNSEKSDSNKPKKNTTLAKMYLK
jgi:MFS transporter, DHA1 family, multidrug resistance protein